jgi:anaphase-promoting complex subunit 6
MKLVLIKISFKLNCEENVIYCLQGNLYEAVESFHKALGIRRDDTFSTTMLNNVIEQLMLEEPPFQGTFLTLFVELNE